MRDRWGYARALTAGSSLALALFASGCLATEDVDDEAPPIAQETTPVVTTRAPQAAANEAKALPAVELRGLADEADKVEAEAPATPPEDVDLAFDDVWGVAHKRIKKGSSNDGVFLDPPPQPWATH